MAELDAANLHRDLQTRWLGQNLIVRERVGSTNDELKGMVAMGTAVAPPDGTVILADFQSQGRGRFDRRWQAPPGTSLLFSVLFRPNWPAQRNNWLAMLGSTAVAEAIAHQTGLEARIKWPNDVVLPLAGVWHKVSGLLLEGEVDEDGDPEAASGRCQTAILGIGVNVNIPQPDLPDAPTPPTSLLLATGQPVSRIALLLDLLVRLETLYEAAVDGNHSPQPAWEQQLVTLGQSVTVTNAVSGQVVVGTAVKTDEWGHLLVRDRDGRVHTIVAGDVTLRSA
jgi:BirA family biotin operon repressor/biotin-[acetyl-CoA-carboxylase] ligase